MTTLKVIVDKDKKPQYKDYVHFLGNYKNGTKSESDHNSSASSLISEYSDTNEMPTKSFQEYLQDYNSKKYQPVQPNFIKKDEEQKNVKTEVYIQINNTKNEEQRNSENQIKITIPKPKLDEIDGGQIQTSNKNKMQKHFLKRSSSITEKTKIFEEKSEESTTTVTKIKANYNEKFPKNIEASTKRINGTKLNPTFIEIRKQELQNCSRLNGTVSPTYSSSGKEENCKSEGTNNTINTMEYSSSNGHNHGTVLISSPVEIEIIIPQENIPKIEHTNLDCAIPAPPPLPPNHLPPKPIPSPVQNSFPKPFSKHATLPKTIHSVSPIPVNTIPKPPINGYSTLPREQNGYSTLPKMQNNKNDVVDSSTLDRNDPRVKKAVYGALRGMYGAYHDKANDYLATLPKNRVKKGNGLDSIIDSIAAQGGLEKLCGRANPKSETDPL